MALEPSPPSRPVRVILRLMTLVPMLGVGLPALGWAQSTAPRVKAEIGALLSRLENSGCQFYRNGNWYPGGEAMKHLNSKFDFIDVHGGAVSTEQFIDLAASKSSLSGQAYLVRCDAAAPVESKVWLKSQLAMLRKARAEVTR